MARGSLVALKPLAIWAVLFVAVSYLPNLLPQRDIDVVGLTLFWTFYCSTVMILCDQAALRLEGRSLLIDITRDGRAFLSFVAVGTASGVLLDGTAQWLGKLWIYPYWNTATYAATFVIGFCAYWLLLAETYLAAKALLRRVVPKSGPIRLRRRFRLTGIAGAALLAAAIVLAMRDYQSVGGYRFEIAAPTRLPIHFAVFPAAFIGIWLVLEWILHRGSRASFLDAVLSGNLLPLYAALAAGWIFGFFMETVNAGRHFWRYVGWPAQSVQILGVPAVVLLMWPLQYVVFLSVHAAIAREASPGLFD